MTAPDSLATAQPADAVGVPDRRSPFKPERRTVLLLASGLVAVVLGTVVATLPVPYAVFEPGPVRNTLGEVNGERLIAVRGEQTYPTEGQLDLTTVSVFGGPGSPVSLGAAVRGWLDGARAVVPEESVFDPAQTEEDLDAQNQAEMVSSQETATAAALLELGYDVPTTLTVDGFASQGRAADVMESGDVVVSVQGEAVATLAALREALQAVEPGEPVQVGIVRDSEEQSVDVVTTGTDQTQLGVFVDPAYDFPFEVSIAIEDVGGPSAGTMFALGIIDVLTPGAMTGGEHIAGSGTIDDTGTVGPIGGVQQKLVGARDAGADWFLAPAGNCAEVVGAVPDGLRVVRIDTLRGARDAVEAIGAGEGTDALPTC